MDRLRAMEVFLAAAEGRSLSAAAARLGLSNAAVTSQIQTLEAHLRVTLLQRTTRSLRLTEAGAAYLARCRAILRQVDEAEAEAGREDVHGVLRVQVPIAVGHLVLAPALTAFAEAHPALRVVTVLGNEVDSLLLRGIDVAIRIDEVEAGDLVARPIYRSRHVVCAAPAWVARHGMPASPATLDRALCLGWVADGTAAPRIWRLCRGEDQHPVTPEGRLFFNSSDALLSAAVEGAGAVYMLDLLAHAHLRAGRLVPLLPDWETEEQVFYVTYTKTRFTPPKVRAFAEFAAQAFPQHVRQDPARPVRIRKRRLPPL